MIRDFDTRRWNIASFGSPDIGAPLILLLSGAEELTDSLRAALEAAKAPPLWLALPLDILWDRDYTPWPATGTNGRVFAGKAGELLKSAAVLRDALAVELSPGSIYSVGYSLGGLASLWLHSCLSFDGAGSCSGSLWYPGWTRWLSAHPPRGRIYLSLGGKEKNTRDPQMSANPEATELTLRICAASAQKAVFRAEPGGHFKDPDGRTARAIAWLCDSPKPPPRERKA